MSDSMDHALEHERQHSDASYDDVSFQAKFSKTKLLRELKRDARRLVSKQLENSKHGFCKLGCSHASPGAEICLGLVRLEVLEDPIADRPNEYQMFLSGRI